MYNSSQSINTNQTNQPIHHQPIPIEYNGHYKKHFKKWKNEYCHCRQPPSCASGCSECETLQTGRTQTQNEQGG